MRCGPGPCLRNAGTGLIEHDRAQHVERTRIGVTRKPQCQRRGLADDLIAVAQPFGNHIEHLKLRVVETDATQREQC